MQPTSAFMTVTSPILYGGLLLLRCSCSMTDCSFNAHVSRIDWATSWEQNTERSMSPSGRYVRSGTEPNMNALICNGQHHDGQTGWAA